MVEVPDDRGDPQPAGDAGALSPAASYVCLTAAQAATTLLPRVRAREVGRRLVWVLVPACAFVVGIVILRVAAGGPDALAWLGAIATPVLAAYGRVKLPVALGLWLVAWLADGLLAQGAAVGLIMLAASTVAELAARVAPRASLQAAIVVLAVLDALLVWGTQQVELATQALHAARLPHGIPALQDATFAHATMGWLDLVAPALVGVAVGHRVRAAAATAAVAWPFGLLLLVTSTLPGTLPTLAGLVCGSL